MKQFIKNIKLKIKLLIIIFVCIGIITFSFFLLLNALSKCYQEMLYESLSESLSYSAKEIEAYMEKMENLTMMFLSDDR